MAILFGPVYVIYDYVQYEGHGAPLEAWSTEEGAVNRCAELMAGRDMAWEDDRHYDWKLLEIKG